jgi:hypothetical protein
VAVINNGRAPLEATKLSARVFDLAGREVGHQEATLTAAANACTDAFRIAWPGDSAAYLVRLDLRDKAGRPLSDNFYWHARDEKQLRQLDAMPRVKLTGQVSVQRDAQATIVHAQITNSAATPALLIRLTLRDAGSGHRVLPVYYQENYFSLLPGESRAVRIECGATPAELQVDLDGWNVEHASLR